MADTFSRVLGKQVGPAACLPALPARLPACLPVLWQLAFYRQTMTCRKLGGMPGRPSNACLTVRTPFLPL